MIDSRLVKHNYSSSSRRARIKTLIHSVDKNGNDEFNTIQPIIQFIKDDPLIGKLGSDFQIAKTFCEQNLHEKVRRHLNLDVDQNVNYSNVMNDVEIEQAIATLQFKICYRIIIYVTEINSLIQSNPGLSNVEDLTNKFLQYDWSDIQNQTEDSFHKQFELESQKLQK